MGLLRVGHAHFVTSLAAYAALTSDAKVRSKVELQEKRRTMRNSQLAEPMLVAEGGGGDSSKPMPTAWSMLKLTWIQSLSVYSVFLVCLATFPGLTTSLVSTTWHLGDWYPIILVAAYNTGDLFGKSLPGAYRLLNNTTLPIAAALHTLFVPLFLLLAHPSLLPVWARSDLVAISITTLLGVLTGYIGCMALMLGGELGRSPEEREVAGMVTSFSLMMGLASGSNAGLLLMRLVE